MDLRASWPRTATLPGKQARSTYAQRFGRSRSCYFRDGRRDNAAMSAAAKTMTDADLRGFFEHIGTLPPAPAASRPTASASGGGRP